MFPPICFFTEPEIPENGTDTDSSEATEEFEKVEEECEPEEIELQ